MKKIFFAIALISASFAAQAGTINAVELVSNGNFESINSPSFEFYQTVNAGMNNISDWTVGGTSVDLINGAYGAVSGNSIDMLGSPGPGTLSQNLATIVGQKYVLSFDLSANGIGGDSKDIFVNIGSAAQLKFTGDMNHHVTEFINYTATSALTSLSFTSAASGYSGAVLDNVSVTIAVPEPDTYAMLLTGLGLMGFMVRRRKKTS